MQKRIASIYFAPLKAERTLYGGYYDIPAVAKGAEPFVLTIGDKIQRSQEPSPDGKSKITQKYLVNGRDIANDILREWTRDSLGMTPECRPGVWIVRDEVPLTNEDGTPVVDADKAAQWRPATDTEKQTMWAEDLESARIANANWGDYLIQSGDVLAEDPKQWVLIGPLRRIACRYYGKDRPWLQELKDSDIKKCPYCTKAIPIQAVKCPSCLEVVDAARYNTMRAEIVDAPTVPIRPPVQQPSKQQVRA